MVNLNGESHRSVFGLPVLKLAPSRKALLTMQSEDILIINTHWLGRRVWCANEGCPACEISPVRGVGYFIGAVGVDGVLRPHLIETTPNEINRLSAMCQADGLALNPGLIIEASKARQRSPMRLDPTGEGGRVLSDLRPVRRCLAAAAVLANVPLPKAEGSLSKYLEEIRPAILKQIETALATQ